MSTGVYVCPCCKQHLEIDKEYLGVKIECPTCKHQFVVANSLLGRDKEEEKKSFWFNEPHLSEDMPRVEEKQKEKSLDEKLNDLGNCGLGIASLCFILDIVFGTCAFVYATQALSFVRVKNYAKAKELKEEATNVAGIGIFFGIIFWLFVILSIINNNIR